MSEAEDAIIEHVAERAYERAFDERIEVSGQPWDRLNESHREAWRGIVRLVLAEEAAQNELSIPEEPGD